jgi:hypothetical protein
MYARIGGAPGFVGIGEAEVSVLLLVHRHST